MSFTFTILGSGPSGGVPRIGNNWGACDPSNPKNRRRRSACLVQRFGERGRTRLLIDTPPDIREQLLDVRLAALDGVFFTHDHADHTHGIDDLRVVSYNMKRRVEVYFDASTRDSLHSRFRYCFDSRDDTGYPSILVSNVIEPHEPLRIEGPGGEITMLPLLQEHGRSTTLGLRINNLAYCSDVSGFPPQTIEALKGLDMLIIGALRFQPHPSHFSLGQALEWIERLKPRRAVLTHMTTELDYETVKRKLPEHVEPAYDGLEIAFD